jgi:hypothetical protein
MKEQDIACAGVGRRGRMSNVISFHPKKSDLILLYEVVDEDGVAEWGGNNAEHCMQWLSLAPSNSRVLVSGWESDEEDAHLVGQSLDITDIIKAASL